jgi:hypothetical protein
MEIKICGNQGGVEMTPGGKRPGAGRKPLSPDQRPVAVTVRLRPEVAALFRDLCKRAGVSQSFALTAWIKEWW